MAVSAGRLVTILEAQTSQFDARMTAAAGVVERFTRPQILATRAMGQLHLQMRMLTAQALGATGPIGNLASSLLGAFGGPAALALGAGIAGFVLLVRKLADAAKDAAKHTADLTSAWITLLQQKGPGVGLAGRLTGVDETPGLIEQQTAAANRITQLGEALVRAQAMRVSAGPTPLEKSLQAQIAVAITDFGLLNSQIELLAGSLADVRTGLKVSDLERIGTGLQQAVDAATRGVTLGQLPTGPTISLPSPANLPAPTGAEMFAAMRGADFNAVVEQLEHVNAVELQRAKVLAVMGNAEEVARIHGLGLGNALFALSQQMTDTAAKVEEKALLMKIAIVNSIAGAIAGIVSGGGIGGVLGLAGGVLGFVNPLAGAIVAGVGSVISAAESRRQRHTEQQTAQIVTAIEEDEQQAIVVVRSGFEGDVAFEDQLIATLQRLTDRRIAIHPLGA